MKRNLLAIAIPALLVAAGANASIEVWNKDGNKVDFYGRVKAMNHITDRNNGNEGDNSSARLGMSGQTQITDGVTGYGRWEYETKTGDDASNETRYAFAGLNFGDYGSIDYGRNDGVLKAITAYTDVLPEFGGDAADNGMHVLTDRTKAVATYRNSNFFGLTDDVSFALQYADNGDNSDTVDSKRMYRGDDHSDSREAYGANVEWRIFDTGLTVGAGYAQTSGNGHKEVTGSTITGTKNVKTWATGIKYDNYNLYLAANYFQSKYNNYHNRDEHNADKKIKGVELVAQYGIDLDVGRLIPSVAYVQHKYNHSEDDRRISDPKIASGRNLVKYVSVGATYELNKNFSAILEYQFNLLDSKDQGAKDDTVHAKDSGRHLYKAGTKDILGVGVIYQF